MLGVHLHEDVGVYELPRVFAEFGVPRKYLVVGHELVQEFVERLAPLIQTEIGVVLVDVNNRLGHYLPPPVDVLVVKCELENPFASAVVLIKSRVLDYFFHARQKGLNRLRRVYPILRSAKAQAFHIVQKSSTVFLGFVPKFSSLWPDRTVAEVFGYLREARGEGVVRRIRVELLKLEL